MNLELNEQQVDYLKDLIYYVLEQDYSRTSKAIAREILNKLQDTPIEYPKETN